MKCIVKNSSEAAPLAFKVF